MLFTYPPAVEAHIASGSKPFAVAVEEYETNLRQSFESLRPTLTGRVLTSILDIGSGLAGMDVLVSQAFEVQHVHLLDGDGSGEKLNRYSGKPTTPWYDVELGKTLLEANSVATVHAYTTVPDVRVNAVFSFRAWGFHFPIGTHLEAVSQCLVDDGVIITDIRNNTDGVARLEDRGFVRIGSVPSHSTKCDRLVFERRR